MKCKERVSVALMLFCAVLVVGCSNGRTDGPDKPGEVATGLQLDDFSRSRLEWNRKAGELSYRLTYTSGFGDPKGPTQKHQNVYLVMTRPHWVDVSGDSVIATTYRYHPWRLAAPTPNDTVVQPSIGLLELAPFNKRLVVGSEDQDTTPIAHDQLNLQSRRTTRIQAIDANAIKYTTVLAYRIPLTPAARRLADELWDEERSAVLSRLEWLTKDWTPYGVCDVRYDRREGVLIEKRCVFHHMSDQGATLDTVRSHPRRLEVFIERVGA